MSEWQSEYRPAVLDLTPAQQIVVRVIAIAKQYGYDNSSVEFFFGWLADRLALAEAARLARGEEAKLGPLAIFEDPPDDRPPGRFAGLLREKQAQSASMAMVLMADDLQRAYERIAQLEQELAERKALEP
jgi:hypothetical protein